VCVCVCVCVFSPDGQFLLSGGQDGTVRLWSMHTKTNLVAYTGTLWLLFIICVEHFCVRGVGESQTLLSFLISLLRLVLMYCC
jgi:WD40 repeat protein